MAADNFPADGQANAIRVFVADSTLMGNQLLAAALSRDPRFFVVGTAQAAEKVLAGVRRPVDVAIVSGMLVGPSPGVHLGRQLLLAQPALRVVMLLERPERGAVVEAFRAGATGVFCRAEPIDALCRCIESVHRGKVWANDEELRFVLEELGNSPALRAPVMGGPCSLTERELNIVNLVAEGCTNRQIAAELGLNEHTLKSCLQRLFDKLGVSSRAEMVFAGSVSAIAEASDPIAFEQRGDRQSTDQARYDCYSRAAEYSLPGAQLALGEMCIEGRGTARDAVAAYAWFMLAGENSKRALQTSEAYLASLAAGMTDEQVAQAEQRAAQWLSRHPRQSESFAREAQRRATRNGAAAARGRVPRPKHALIA